MTDERRYSQAEIEKIFERAVEPSDATASRPGSEGMTLAELQDIGREVGIPPERLAEAASSLAHAPPSAPPASGRVRRMAGLPIGVGLTVPLPRAPTDRELEQLVADLRETFAARGRVDRHGSLMHWNNGNLHAAVEPTQDGYRLRMGTTKGQARPLVVGGSIMLVIGIVFIVLAALGITSDPEGVVTGLFLAALGAGQVGFGAIPLPAWADERQRQMEDIAERLTNRLARPATAVEPAPGRLTDGTAETDAAR